MSKKQKSLILLIGLPVGIYLIFFLLQPTRFGSAESMFILLQQSLLPSVAACGFYFILSMGLFDFSLGANIILSAIVGCLLSSALGYPGLILGCLLTGALVGAVNGVLYLQFKIPSIIATIGLLILYECLACLIAGDTANVLSENMRILGRAPYNVVIAGLAFLLAAFLIHKTRVGIYTKAIGANESMSNSMGVNVARYKIIGFTLCGFFAGITALLTISYSSTIIPVQGMSSMARNFQPIMGCFIGVAFKKYINPVISILLGELMIAMIINGIMTNGADSTLQSCIIGLTLLAIVSVMSRDKRNAVVK